MTVTAVKIQQLLLKRILGQKQGKSFPFLHFLLYKAVTSLLANRSSVPREFYNLGKAHINTADTKFSNSTSTVLNYIPSKKKFQLLFCFNSLVL